MRAKVVLSASALAVLILAPALYLRFAPSKPAADSTAPAPDQVATAPQIAPAPPVVAHHIRKIAPNEAVDQAPSQDSADNGQDDPVAKRQAELTQLGMSDDPADLKTILSSLNDKSADIRKSALDAAVQFGSKDAIPALQNEMAWTEDPQEKVDLQNAIKYLQLPSFQEFTANIATGNVPQQSSSDQAPPAN